MTETTVKPRPLAFILFGFQYWESLSSFTSRGIFSVVNIYVNNTG